MKSFMKLALCIVFTYLRDFIFCRINDAIGGGRLSFVFKT